MSERAEQDGSEYFDGKLYEQMVEFEDRRAKLYDFLSELALSDREFEESADDAVVMELALDTAEAFAGLATQILRTSDRQSAIESIVDFWHEDDEERSELLAHLAGTDDFILFERDDIAQMVTSVVTGEQADDELGSLLGTTYYSSLLGDWVEYENAVSYSYIPVVNFRGLDVREIAIPELQERSRLLAATALALLPE
jgi:hypothetical protein